MFNVQTTFDPRLRERDMGPLEGLTLTEISEIVGRRITISKFVGEDFPEKVESLSSLKARINSFICDLKKMDFEQCLIVGHGGSLAILISQIVGMPHNEIKFGNCEIKKIIMSGNDCVLKEFD
ncbi:phosphoglycerate mutase family protein [mine drainage metagenome]|uniref:Phosphoglycerate mutase family protein n=1 Tax=mine drainage metagenome TaxID=410659 RepID=T1CZ71_9ZZZZ